MLHILFDREAGDELGGWDEVKILLDIADPEFQRMLEALKGSYSKTVSAFLLARRTSSLLKKMVGNRRWERAAKIRGTHLDLQ
jgi:hypothetical protein